MIQVQMQVIYVFLGLLIFSVLVHFGVACSKSDSKSPGVKTWSIIAVIALLAVGGYWTYKFVDYKKYMNDQGFKRFDGNPFSEDW